jgi:hypothetical protein
MKMIRVWMFCLGLGYISGLQLNLAAQHHNQPNKKHHNKAKQKRRQIRTPRLNIDGWMQVPNSVGACKAQKGS